jgi:hypothetical protein
MTLLDIKIKQTEPFGENLLPSEKGFICHSEKKAILMKRARLII